MAITELAPGSGQRLRNRRLNLANGLLFTGALMMGGFMIHGLSQIIEQGGPITPARTLVNDYERTAVALGEKGKLDQIPQKYDSQKVEDAYKAVHSESDGANVDLVVGLSGGIIFVAGMVKKAQEGRRTLFNRP